MKHFVFFLFAVSVLFASLVSSAHAMHENDHRFKVYGTVRDDNGDIAVESKVMVVVVRIDEGVTVFTDSKGYYETVLHVHDENLGDEILVSAMGVTKKIIADFIAGDTKVERGLEVNFGTSKKVSPSSSSGSGKGKANNFVVYGVVGVLLLGGIFFIVSKKGKKEENLPKNKGKKKANR